MTGEDPPEQIDHIDRDATNNRWGNLCDGVLINQRNKSIQRNNTSGFSGVCWNKQVNKWGARVWCEIDSKRVYKHIGLFLKKEDAANAVKDFRNKNGYTDGHGNHPPYEVSPCA